MDPEDPQSKLLSEKKVVVMDRRESRLGLIPKNEPEIKNPQETGKLLRGLS